MKLTNLSKTYGGKTVLEIDAFSFQSDTIYAVVGPNGSGKSTLGRIAAGILEPDNGGCILLDEGETVGYMPQNSYGFQMSVWRNVLLAAPDTPEASEKAARLLARMELTQFRKARASRLSGGETARMALARILMTERKLLILDEPTAALDVKSTLAAEELIGEYREKNRGTILLITHSLTQARRVSDYVLFLYEGRLLEHGPANQVLSSPESPETRAFIDFYGK